MPGCLPAWFGIGRVGVFPSSDQGHLRMCAGAALSETRLMAEGPAKTFRSGDALFAFDADLVVLSWNQAAEELTASPPMKRSDAIAGMKQCKLQGELR